MKKQIIKSCTVLIILSAMILSIMGCANSSTVDPQSSSEEGSKKNAEEGSSTSATSYSLPFADGSVTLTFQTFDSWYAPASYSNNLHVWEEFEKRTGVNIKFETLPFSDSAAVIQTRMASGSSLPDITAVPPWDSGAGVTEYVSEDLLLCLDPYLESGCMPNTKAFFTKYPNLAAQMKATDGKFYSLANQLSLINAVIPRAIIIREDWAQKAGLTNFPVTIADWENYLRIVKNGDYNENGKADEIPLITEGIEDLLFFASGFGFDVAPDEQSNFFYSDESGKVSFALTDDRMKECIIWLNSLYKEGLIHPQIENGSDTIWSLYPQNVVGAYSRAACDYITRADGLLENIDDKAIHKLVLPPSKDPSKLIKIQSRPDTEFIFAITKACKEPEIAAKWMDYVYASKEGNILKDFGIEGLSYELDEKDEPYYTDYITKNDKKLSMHDMMRTLGGAPSFLVFDTEAAWHEKQKDTTVWSEGVRLGGMQVAPFPVMIPSEEENTILLNDLADIKTYYTEMMTKFVIGTANIDEWDGYVSNLKEMGIDNVLEVYQAQYDRYKKFAGK